MRLRVLTNSELKTYRRCPLEHHYAYDLGVRTVETARALAFGTMFHVALEAWWKESSTLYPITHGEQRLAAALATLPLDADPFELARAVELLRGYTLRWGEEPLWVVAVEREFRIPLINPRTGKPSKTFELAGKIDAIARRTDSERLFIVEHKTSGDSLKTGSPYWRCLELDAQVSTYYHGARSIGFDVSGVLYDVIGKPKHKPALATPRDEWRYRKDGELYANVRTEDESPADYQARVREAIAEAPDSYFVRGEVVRLEDEDELAAWERWQLATQIRESNRIGWYPRNTDACRRYGRLCDYFGVCTKSESLDDASRFRLVEKTHEELSL